MRGLAVIGVLFAVLAVRAVTASRSALARGDALAASEDIDGAILAYRSAARWYAPANPYVDEALDRLAGIAADAEGRSDLSGSLAAWRSVRGAILATRSFYTPHRARLRRAEEAIQRLVSATAPRARAEASRRRARAAMRAPERPARLWTIVLLAGWLAWTGGAFVFAQRALDEEDRVRVEPARLWGTVVVVGFGIFVLGLTLA